MRLAWICFLLGSLSCSRGEPEDVEPSPTAGRYTWGAEVDAFAPCGDTLEYWVTGTNEIRSDMAARYQALATEPYEPMFALVRGDTAGRASEGFPADYDGLFRVDQVVELRRLTDADCPAGR